MTIKINKKGLLSIIIVLCIIFSATSVVNAVTYYACKTTKPTDKTTISKYYFKGSNSTQKLYTAHGKTGGQKIVVKNNNNKALKYYLNAGSKIKTPVTVPAGETVTKTVSSNKLIYLEFVAPSNFQGYMQNVVTISN